MTREEIESRRAIAESTGGATQSIGTEELLALCDAALRAVELEALMKEGIGGFSRVLVGTSDQRRVYDWIERCRRLLERNPHG